MDEPGGGVTSRGTGRTSRFPADRTGAATFGPVAEFFEPAGGNVAPIVNSPTIPFRPGTHGNINNINIYGNGDYYLEGTMNRALNTVNQSPTTRRVTNGLRNTTGGNFGGPLG